MTTISELRAALDPIVDKLGLSIYDVELAGRVLKVTVDRAASGEGAIGIDAIAAVTEAINPALDQLAPFEGSYALEVSSPGLERTLRRPEHYRSAQGSTVSVKVRLADGTVERWHGVLSAVTDRGATVTTGDGHDEGFCFDDVIQARTVFEWGPSPKPGKGKGKGARARKERERV